jgi:hypothetical protein
MRESYTIRVVVGSVVAGPMSVPFGSGAELRMHCNTGLTGFGHTKCAMIFSAIIWDLALGMGINISGICISGNGKRLLRSLSVDFGNYDPALNTDLDP